MHSYAKNCANLNKKKKALYSKGKSGFMQKENCTVKKYCAKKLTCEKEGKRARNSFYIRIYQIIQNLHFVRIAQITQSHIGADSCGTVCALRACLNRLYILSRDKARSGTTSATSCRWDTLIKGFCSIGFKKEVEQSHYIIFILIQRYENKGLARPCCETLIGY